MLKGKKRTEGKTENQKSHNASEIRKLYPYSDIGYIIERADKDFLELCVKKQTKR